MSTISVKKASVAPKLKWADGIVVLLMPALAYMATLDLPGWVQMWALTGAVFFGLKWLTFNTIREAAPSLGRAIGYWLLWPGMNAREFFGSKTARRPKLGEWCGAAAKCLLGLALVAVALRGIDTPARIAAAWVGIGGMVLVAHFGLFIWRRWRGDRRASMRGRSCTGRCWRPRWASSGDAAGTGRSATWPMSGSFGR